VRIHDRQQANEASVRIGVFLLVLHGYLLKATMTIPLIATRASFQLDPFNPRIMLRAFLRLIRQPIIRFLAQGDLILVGDVLAQPGHSPMVQVLGDRDCVIYGEISIDENNPHSIVPMGLRPAKPVRAAKSGNWSDPATWTASQSIKNKESST
jgi:hypothetical protein